MSYNVIRPASGHSRDITGADRTVLRHYLERDGWALLRGFDVDMARFSALVADLCPHITFDPARDYSETNTQKVDAGLGPIGLHIENGNTPKCPDLVAFYARRAAFEGSQTTICDGVAVLADFDDKLRARWAQKLRVERRLPEDLWKRYLVNEHPALSDPGQIAARHIQEFKAAIPDQDYILHEDGSLTYILSLDPLRRSRFCGKRGFANALLGPSTNYEAPRYSLADGSPVATAEIEALRDICEAHTHEINWQDGDIAVLDNSRVMHGRRAIIDPERELFIGMGSL